MSSTKTLDTLEINYLTKEQFSQQYASSTFNNDALWLVYDDNKGDYIFSQFILEASGWDTNNVYSFESIYPNSEYDIEIAPSENMTLEEYNVFSKAKIVGNGSYNKIKALGTKPAINLTVLLKTINR